MKVFSRNIAIVNTIPKMLQFTMACVRAVQRFEDPWHLIFCYIRKQPLDREVLKMRSGHQIVLSRHTHDVITIIVVFCKEDYGMDFQGKTVLDVGANIGIFSLCAALGGAKKVISIEPSMEAFRTLQHNVRINGLDDVITPLQYAVSDADGDTIPFPISASPYNKVGLDPASADFADVQTCTLKTVLDTWFEGRIDLLKMDCEGAEFEIFASTGREELARISEIKMEYHREEYKGLLDRLMGENFEVSFHQPGRQPSTGTVWLTNGKVI